MTAGTVNKNQRTQRGGRKPTVELVVTWKTSKRGGLAVHKSYKPLEMM